MCTEFRGEGNKNQAQPDLRLNRLSDLVTPVCEGAANESGEECRGTAGAVKAVTE